METRWMARTRSSVLAHVVACAARYRSLSESRLLRALDAMTACVTAVGTNAS